MHTFLLPVALFFFLSGPVHAASQYQQELASALESGTRHGGLSVLGAFEDQDTSGVAHLRAQRQKDARLAAHTRGAGPVARALNGQISKEFYQPLTVILDEGELPALQGHVAEVAQKAGVRKPLTALRSNGAINGHAVINPFDKSTYLEIHKGAIDKLTADELEALIAHEFGHLYHAHESKLRSAALLMAVFYAVALVQGGLYCRTLIKAYRELWDKSDSTLPWYKRLFSKKFLPLLSKVLLVLGGLGALAPLAARFYFYLRKRSEYEADLFAAKNKGKEAVISLQKKLGESAHGHSHRSFAYSSHPPAHKRIAYLEREG